LGFLVWANETVGSSGAVSPAAARRGCRGEMLFPDADDRPESAAPGAVDRCSWWASLSGSLSSLIHGFKVDIPFEYSSKRG
jgi:hypothetical protein